jgi:uncharacterized protein YrrD
VTTFGEAKGRQVVSTSTAGTLGKVEGFVIDPEARRVVALRLKKHDVLRWSDLTAFGSDAVTVSGADRVGPADGDLERLADKKHDAVGKRVLSSTGDELGRLDDVEFDATTGEVTALVLDSGTVVGGRLLGIGSYAVVVDAEQGH